MGGSMKQIRKTLTNEHIMMDLDRMQQDNTNGDNPSFKRQPTDDNVEDLIMKLEKKGKKVNIQDENGPGETKED